MTTPRRYRRFTCCSCGRKELAPGGNSMFRCAQCKPLLSPFEVAKRRAHKAVADARRAGVLRSPREFACKDCGAPAVEYDHRDYSQPLAVEPLCRRCNLRRGHAAFQVMS